MSQSVERFSSRVENYAKYRPGYPTQIVALLQTDCGLVPQSVIADIGSGTGKLSELFLKNRNVVLGVEPNKGMRLAAERILAEYPNFKSVVGTAETTTLDDASVDFITAGQAFHWFKPANARIEASRILKPGGWVALIWNVRKLQSSTFLGDYEALLLKYATDYQNVRHENAEASIEGFFAPQAVTLKIFPNEQVVDLGGLKGSMRSSSYTPEPEHPNFSPLVHELEQIFDKHQRNGRVVFDYDTKVFYGHLPGNY